MSCSLFTDTDPATIIKNDNKVLIIASTRIHVDSFEIVRLQDSINALLKEGYKIDLLLAHKSSSISLTIPTKIRTYTLPSFFSFSKPPNRISLRRFIMQCALWFYAFFLMCKNRYDILHGINDAAIVVCLLAKNYWRSFPYIAELHQTLIKKTSKWPHLWITRKLEEMTLQQADTVIVTEDTTLATYADTLSKARISVVPNPHIQINADDTQPLRDFNESIRLTYTYTLSQRYDNS